jgi:hypothetical protein
MIFSQARLVFLSLYSLRILRTIESQAQNTVSYIKNGIVVRSVIVPAVNASSNVLHLWAAGVPLSVIVQSIPKKTKELEIFMRKNKEIVDLTVKKNTASTEMAKLSYQRQIDQIQYYLNNNLSISPLLKRGEMSTIANIGSTPMEVSISDGKVGEWVEQHIDKLPEPARTLARYGAVTKDTAVYQFLEKSVQYGDFVAKAILYDHLKARGVNEKAALMRCTEEFVDYDKAMGRTRQYLESIGLAWFFNYKIRSIKVGASLMRNRPFLGLLSMMIPAFVPLPGLGSAITDNLVSVIARTGLGDSIGLGMAFRGFGMNPWINAMT